KPPQYGQLYIFDTAHEIQNRMKAMLGSKKSKETEESVVEVLVNMLDETNFLAKEFRKARDKYESGETQKKRKTIQSPNNGRISRP
ncbi:hypothetical protein EUTSA_v10027535mg, partial [Eutrema salsugineum]